MSADSAAMRTLLALAAVGALAGCGLETASTAATAGAIKKQEVQEGQKTMKRAQQRVDAAAQQIQDRAAATEAKTEQ